MSDSEVNVSTRQAAALLQVHVSSVKRWCNGEALHCTYTPGGHRRIPLGTLLGFARAQALSCPLLDFAPDEAAVWRGVEAARASGDFGPLIACMMGWLDADQRRMPARLMFFLEEMGVPFAHLCDGLLTEVMHRVGRRWHRGEMSVGEEHRMTQIVRDSLHTVRTVRYLRVPKTPGVPSASAARETAVVGCIAGDEHELGAQMVRLLLEMAGWHVVYLGPNVPHEDYAHQQVRHQAGLVCVSFTPPRATGEARHLVRMLSHLQTDAMTYRLVLGGEMLEEDLMAASGAERFLDVRVFNNMKRFAEWLDSLVLAREGVPEN